MFSNCRWWGFQHMLSKVNEDLVQFTSPQQVEVLYDLKQQHCERKSAPAKACHQQTVLYLPSAAPKDQILQPSKSISAAGKKQNTNTIASRLLVMLLVWVNLMKTGSYFSFSLIFFFEILFISMGFPVVKSEFYLFLTFPHFSWLWKPCHWSYLLNSHYQYNTTQYFKTF